MTDITWSLLIQIISFLVFFLVLRRVFFVPVLRNMEKREETITALLEEAEERREKSVELQERISERLNEAREEAAGIVDRAEEDARQRYQEIVSSAREESDRILAEARVEIEKERDRALESFRGEAVNLAQMISEKVLGRQLDVGERNIMETEVHQTLKRRRD
ncbi:MAG: F0F1 ATP synthase subunit B [Bacillota bacterium]